MQLLEEWARGERNLAWMGRGDFMALRRGGGGRCENESLSESQARGGRGG